jgi:hypothetical protein
MRPLINWNFLFDFPIITRPIARNCFPLQGFSRFWSAVFPVVQGEAGFAFGGLPTAGDAVLPIDSGDTSPCVPGVVIEMCSASRSLYPAGDGSIAIFASMPANSRRVRWLSANINQ